MKIYDAITDLITTLVLLLLTLKHVNNDLVIGILAR